MKPEVQKSAKKPRSNPSQFGRELRMELNKVTWPTRQQAVRATLIILLVTAISTLYVSGLDVVLAKLYLMLKG